MNKDKKECKEDIKRLITFETEEELDQFVDDLFCENLYFHRMTTLLTSYQRVEHETLLKNIRKMGTILTLFKTIYTDVKFYEMIIFTPGYSLL